MSTSLLLPSSSKGSKDGVCMTITSIPILRCKSKRLQQVIPTSLASGGMGNGDGMVAWLGIGDLFSSPSGFIIVG